MIILEKISFEIFRQPLADLMSHSSPPTREGVSWDKSMNSGWEIKILLFVQNVVKGIGILTNKEAEQVRCLIAKCLGIPPDNVVVIISIEDCVSLFCIEKFNGFDTLIGFKEVPTVGEI